MSIKDEILTLIKPIAASYTTPRGVAAGIASLINPAAGALIRYGPEVASMIGRAGQAAGTGDGQMTNRTPFGGMSGMMPLSGGAGTPRGGLGVRSDLPLSDLSQYFRRGSEVQDVPMMRQGGQVIPQLGSNMNQSMVQQLFSMVPQDSNMGLPDREPISIANLLSSQGPSRLPINLGITELGANLRALDAIQGSGDSGSAPMSSLLDMGLSAGMTTPNPFFGGSRLGLNLDQSQIDRMRDMIRQRQQEMAQPAPQQPQIDPAAIQARLDAFLANNPDRANISLPFGGSIDMGNLRDRMARLSALMGRGMTAQEAMGNQRAAIAQGHDLNNDGIVTDAEYMQSTMPMQNREVDVRAPGQIMVDNTRMNAPMMGAMA